MSVNFSSKQFSCSDLVDALRSTLKDTGVEPYCLQLEITESAILERSYRTSSLLDAIRALGIELAIDDFGTGYSSLAALAHLSVDALKIDRSFIAGMNTPRGIRFVHSLVGLARTLGLTLIAEGIEDPGHITLLKDADCDFGQGFAISKPLDTVAADSFLTAAGYGLTAAG